MFGNIKINYFRYLNNIKIQTVSKVFQQSQTNTRIFQGRRTTTVKFTVFNKKFQTVYRLLEKMNSTKTLKRALRVSCKDVNKKEGTRRPTFQGIKGTESSVKLHFSNI